MMAGSQVGAVGTEIRPFEVDVPQPNLADIFTTEVRAAFRSLRDERRSS
jgi:hypothetical protein